MNTFETRTITIDFRDIWILSTPICERLYQCCGVFDAPRKTFLQKKWGCLRKVCPWEPFSWPQNLADRFWLKKWCKYMKNPYRTFEEIGFWQSIMLSKAARSL
jgi:hypothetical protein